MTTFSVPGTTTTTTTSDPDREFWRGVLLAGGSTAIPRWTLSPMAGTGQHAGVIPGRLVADLRRLADGMGITLSSVLLAVQARVLAALSGERDVTTGYVARPAAGGQADGRPGRQVLPARLATGAGSWRELLLDACRAESQLLAHQHFGVGELRRELDLTAPPPETVFDPAAGDSASDSAGDSAGGDSGGGLDPGIVLAAGIAQYGDSLVLRLRYRTDTLDADAAARIFGYYRTAMELITADPDAAHRRQSLLSAGELRYQIEGLAGPRRMLPQRRFHEIFEDKAGRYPDAVAAVRGEREWTYSELNARANRLARALLARGLRREDVVAVVTERTLDWMAAVLAVFKAGGVYLPIEPHFPAGRITATLSRAGCELVLTEPGAAGTLDAALGSLPGVQTLFLEDAYREDHADGDLGIPVAPDQLAYIFFTSGSTGEPKGAMCEHAGMLNHLYAKIEDLGIGDGQVVAQTAPQCFDISVWQLVAALLAGGQTLLSGRT